MPWRSAWGVDRGRLADFTDLDLLGAIQWCGERLAENGNAESMAMLAEHDAEEAQLRAFYERPDVAGRCKVQLEPNVRWPYLRARARSAEEQTHYRGPRSARTEDELQQKINAMLATRGSRA